MKILQNINYTILSGFLLAFYIAYSIMGDNQSMASNLITMSFVYVFGLFFLNRRYNYSKEYTNILYWCIPLVFINVTLSGFGGFDYYKKAIMFTTTLLWIVYTCNTTITKKTAYIICLIMLALNISYQFFYESGLAIYEGEALLYLGFTNPNLAGMYILNSMLYLGILIVAGRELFSKKKWYFVHVAVSIFVLFTTFGLLMLTGCRSAILSLIAFGVLVVADFFFLQKIKPRKWICYLIAIAPLLFVFFYVFYIKTLDVNVSFGLEDAGKSSTTRLKIWSPLVDNFFHFLIYGDYYGISNGTGFSQMHNTHFDVYASYGIIPLMLYMSLLAKVIWNTWSRAASRFQRCSVYAFVATFIVSTFEAGFVAGSAGLFLLTCGFLILSNTQTDENPTNK